MTKLYPQTSDMCYICNEENLCPIRKKDGKGMVRFLDGNGGDTEIELRSVLNEEEFMGKKINKLYSSGFVFLKGKNKEDTEVFLLTTDKNGVLQHQFTGGGPIEEKYESIFTNNDEDDLIINMELVIGNAKSNLYERTKITKVNVQGEIQTADWVLKPSFDHKSWDLIFLIHFLAGDDFEGELQFNKGNSKNVVGGKWYSVDGLNEVEGIAPNIVVVTSEMMKKSL